jgi:hypothetical protein
MEKSFLAGVVALFLATGTAHTEQITWELNNYKRCNAFVLVSPASGIKLPESGGLDIDSNKLHLRPSQAASSSLHSQTCSSR